MKLEQWKKIFGKFKQNRWFRWIFLAIGLAALVIFSNLYLQWCQNNLDTHLAYVFAFSWHTEKFFLGCLVLFVYLLFLCSLSGSIKIGSLFYSVSIGILGYADYQKMLYRTEPIYPDDLKMITEFGLLREMIGTVAFVFALGLGLIAVVFFCWAIYKSTFLTKKQQIVRGTVFVVSISLLGYFSQFNNPDNLLRKAYNQTALWIPYSQKMNYYNTGFIGGFLYNLSVEAMEKPEGYSKEAVKEVTEKYQKAAEQANKDRKTEAPNIIFVMSESFSNPLRLNGVTANKNPLEAYETVSRQTYSGQMLSQNYGGGTANIEFEALTSFSMELFNPQMNTPYTMLVPKMKEIPSIVSLLSNQNYQTTAIHPYNTTMYKRKDVYEIFGFDTFLDETTMTYTDKIQENPYISDKSAYKEILTILKDSEKPQFVHLVTMQTHMPYSDKYPQRTYSSKSEGNKTAIDSFMQDISYSSEAFADFIEEIKQLDQRTLVVFWGDHLPSIYSDEIKEENEEATLHETEFLMYDNQKKLKSPEKETLLSPFYFAPQLFEESGLKITGFYQLLNELKAELPAFEKGFYYQGGEWKQELALNKGQEALYKDYQLIQYDIVSGEQYSLKTDFFKE